MNNVYVSSTTVSVVLGDDLTATCNWNVDGEIFTNTTTAQGIINDILLLVQSTSVNSASVNSYIKRL